jgi:hypothetical protein
MVEKVSVGALTRNRNDKTNSSYDRVDLDEAERWVEGWERIGIFDDVVVVCFALIVAEIRSRVIGDKTKLTGINFRFATSKPGVSLT